MNTYILYIDIDILGFADLVENDEDNIRRTIDIIDSLSLHDHPEFRSIVFSDTILVYLNNEVNSLTPPEDRKWAIGYLCEFAEDLQIRTEELPVFFRAVITEGNFSVDVKTHASYFYGTALIHAYRTEKEIPAIGLFLDHSLNQWNDAYPVAPFIENKLDFVFLDQCLETLQLNTNGDLPISEFVLRETDEYGLILFELKRLRTIYANMRNHADPRVRAKHLMTWDYYFQRYPKILEHLVREAFDPKIICPEYDWSRKIEIANYNAK